MELTNNTMYKIYNAALIVLATTPAFLFFIYGDEFIRMIIQGLICMFMGVLIAKMRIEEKDMIISTDITS